MVEVCLRAAFDKIYFHKSSMCFNDKQTVDNTK